MFRIILVICALALAPKSYGQLKFNLDHLAARATETVDITLDSSTIALASKFLSSAKADEASVKNVLSGLVGISVRGFEFANKGAYSPADLEPIRTQLRAPGWTRVVNIQSKGDGETAEVYLKQANGKAAGIAIIAAEPKELTIVEILGPIDMEQLGDLAGKFGIPDIRVSKPKPSEGSKGNKD
jgi:hypothetical protein